MTKRHSLFGKTITEILLAEDKKAILFKTDSGEIIARCDGDCCSSTWVESIELPAAGFPCVVSEVTDLDSYREETSDYDSIAHYGLKITTNKGDLVIDYRNSSNGYYGGSLSWPEDSYFYGGVYGQNISNNDWKTLTADL